MIPREPASVQGPLARDRAGPRRRGRPTRSPIFWSGWRRRPVHAGRGTWAAVAGRALPFASSGSPGLRGGAAVAKVTRRLGDAFWDT